MARSKATLVITGLHKDFQMPEQIFHTQHGRSSFSRVPVCASSETALGRAIALKEQSLIMGVVEGPGLEEVVPSTPEMLDRLRLTVLYERLIQGCYQDISEDFDSHGPIQGAPDTHALAHTISLWLAGSGTCEPDFSADIVKPHPDLPLSSEVAIYLAILTVRKLFRQGSPDAAFAAYKQLSTALILPSESPFLSGELAEVQRMLLGSVPQPVPPTPGPPSREPRSYETVSLLVGRAFEHAMAGDYATASALMGSIQDIGRWQGPLRGRALLVGLSIAVAMTDLPSVEAIVREVDQLVIEQSGASSGDVSRLFEGSFAICTENSDAALSARILAIISAADLPVGALPLRTERLICDLIGNGDFAYADVLTSAMHERSLKDGNNETAAILAELAPVIRARVLCSGLLQSQTPTPAENEKAVKTAISILNSAHERYLLEGPQGAADLLDHVTESELSALDRFRCAVLRCLTRPTSSGYEKLVELLTNELSPELAESLFPLIRDAGWLALESGYTKLSLEIITVLEDKLRDTSGSYTEFLVYSALSYEAAYDHGKAVYFLEKLSTHGVMYLDTHGGLKSLTTWRLARNLWLAFNHARALPYIESLLKTLSPYSPAVAHERIELLQMSAVSYEAELQPARAQACWLEILQTLSTDQGQWPARGEAAYNAARLSERAGDYDTAVQLYSAAQEAQEHSNEQSAAMQSQWRHKFCLLQLQRETEGDITYILTSPSSDTRHLIPSL